jgi:phenylalanyl-tRNA synthetase alpha chain
VRERLGCAPDQKNVLVRVTLRDLEGSITNAAANALYEQIYARVNYGSGGYAA